MQPDDGNSGTDTAAVSISVTEVNEDPDTTRSGVVSLGANAAVQDVQYYRGKSLDWAGGDEVDCYTFTTDGR